MCAVLCWRQCVCFVRFFFIFYFFIFTGCIKIGCTHCLRSTYAYFLCFFMSTKKKMPVSKWCATIWISLSHKYYHKIINMLWISEWYRISDRHFRRFFFFLFSRVVSFTICKFLLFFLRFYCFPLRIAQSNWCMKLKKKRKKIKRTQAKETKQRKGDDMKEIPNTQHSVIWKRWKTKRTNERANVIKC